MSLFETNRSPDRIEVVVFADDASKIQRIYDNLEPGLRCGPGWQRHCGESDCAGETGLPPPLPPARTETVQTEQGAVEFEVGGFEDDIELSAPYPIWRKAQILLRGVRQKNPVQGEAERSPSGPSSPDRSSSPGSNRPVSTAPEQKTSVRKQLQEIRQEQAQKKEETGQAAPA